MHAQSIYSLPKNDGSKIYAFAYGMHPYHFVYKWLNKHFIEISSSLGKDGWIILTDPEKLDEELAGAYSCIDKNLGALRTYRRKKYGLIVTTINPHCIRSEKQQTTDVLFIPLEGYMERHIENLISMLINASKSGDLTELRGYADPIYRSSKERFIKWINDGMLIQPNIAGIGFNLSKLIEKYYSKTRPLE